MAISRLRSSPSFIVGILVVIALGGAYLWRHSRPHSRGASDGIVRDFVTTAQKEVYECRRNAQRAVDKLRSGDSPADVLKAIDAAVTESTGKVEGHAETALDRLQGIADLPLRTERNRRLRIRSRLREFKDAIAEVRDDAAEDVHSYREEHEGQSADKKRTGRQGRDTEG